MCFEVQNDENKVFVQQCSMVSYSRKKNSGSTPEFSVYVYILVSAQNKCSIFDEIKNSVVIY